MSETIIDVITRLSYELVGDSNLSKTINDFKQQAKAIDDLKTKLEGLKKNYDTSKDAQQQQQLKTAIDKTTDSIDKRTAALTKSFTENKKVQDAIQDEIGLLGGINKAISENEDLRSKAAKEDIDFYNKEIEALKNYRKELLSTGTAAKQLADARQFAQGEARAEAMNTSVGKTQNGNVIQVAKGESKADDINEQLAIESGYIGRINKQIKELEITRLKANREAIGGINQEIAALEKEKAVALNVGKSESLISQLFGLKGTAGGVGGQLLSGALLGLGVGGGIGAISKLFSALTEAAQNAGSEILNTLSFQEKFKQATDSLISSLEKEIQTLNDLDPDLSAYAQRAAALQNEINLLKTIGAVNLEIFKNKQEVNDLEVSAAEKNKLTEQVKLNNEVKILNAIKAAREEVVKAGTNVPNTPTIAQARGGEKGNLERIKEIFAIQSKGDTLLGESLQRIFIDIDKSGASNVFRPNLTKALDQVIKRQSFSTTKQETALSTSASNVHIAEIKLDEERRREVEKLNDDLLNREKQGNIEVEKEQVRTNEARIKNTQYYYQSDSLLRQAHNQEARDLSLDLESKINAIDREIVQKTRELGSLDADTVKYYEDIKSQARQESAQKSIRALEEYKKQLIDFHIAQINSEREADESILKARAIASQNELTQLEKDGGDTFATRQELLQQQAQIEANEINKKYFNEIAANKKLNVDTSELEKERQLAFLTLQNKYAKLQIDLLVSYYNNRLSNIKLFEDNEAAIISSDASEQKIRAAQRYEDGLESLRKYHKDIQRENFEAAQQQKEQAVRDATVELHEAKARRDAILNNPNSTAADKDRALLGVNNATNKLGSATEANTNKGTLRTGFAAFITNQEINNPALTQQQQLQLEVNKTAETYKALSETVVQTFDAILSRQQAALDQEIQIRTERVNIALKLAERGNTDALAIEQDRLKQAERQRAQSAKRQAAINAGLVVSNSLVAVAEAAAEGGGIGSIATIIAIVAALGAGFAAVESLSTKNNPTGFFKGGYTGDGNTHDIAGPVHKGEFVMPAHITQNPNNRAMLEAMYNHSFDPALMTAAYAGNNGRVANMGETNKHLVNITDRLDNLEFRAENRIDRNGVHQLVETASAQERRRFA